jgi:hypothetical protein
MLFALVTRCLTFVCMKQMIFICDFRVSPVVKVERVPRENLVDDNRITLYFYRWSPGAKHTENKNVSSQN